MFASYYSKELAERTARQIRNHRGWYIFEGLLFIAIGITAFFMPRLTALTIEFLLATLFLAGGVIRFSYGLFNQSHRRWRLISGAVYAVAGAAIFAWPITGLAALLTVVGALLLLEGVFDIAVALTMRPSKGWSWMLVAGIASIVLGIVIFAGFPETGILYLAIAFGVSFVLYGASILAIAFTSNQPTNDHERDLSNSKVEI